MHHFFLFKVVYTISKLCFSLWATFFQKVLTHALLLGIEFCLFWEQDEHLYLTFNPYLSFCYLEPFLYLVSQKKNTNLNNYKNRNFEGCVSQKRASNTTFFLLVFIETIFPLISKLIIHSFKYFFFFMPDSL